MDAAEVLKVSGWFLSDPRRWHQGANSTLDGKACCAIGAILRCAAYTSPSYRGAVAALANVLGLPPEDGYPITVWNDDPRRTHSEVVEAFQRAHAYALQHG